MTPDIKRKWIAALRSGEYRQAQQFLQSGEHHYCCLGVLLHTTEQEVYISGYAGHEESDEWLNEEGLEHYGLTHCQQIHLAEMNDSGNSFEEIADYIETNL